MTSDPTIRPDEYYLTDMAEILSRAGHTVACMEVSDSSELLGINTRLELAAADQIFRTRKVRELLLAGVTIEKPETVTIDAQVQIGADSIIGPFAQILGRSVLGEDCMVGACSIVSDSQLADRVMVGPFTVIGESPSVKARIVGPFARLRGNNVVGANARIGNFVELKKTKFGQGAKANHLAYLGDADIGEKSNIGAGTITCNYDGVSKHKTVIGDNSFIGSNSTLVAPIEIASDAYIGAGSVITDPVPAGALAIGRGRQVTKEGWVARAQKVLVYVTGASQSIQLSVNAGCTGQDRTNIRICISNRKTDGNVLKMLAQILAKVRPDVLIVSEDLANQPVPLANEEGRKSRA